MLPIDRLIRITVLVLVVISGLLLGISLSHWGLTLIALIGAIGGYLIADHWKIFRLDGVLANIASVLILLLAMKDFLPGDSTGKLISVANLLVYLQTVLMFQEKTPRLVWQILVLSLLQVVVSAIFSLDFEGGMLFLFYFPVAVFALMLQAIHSSNQETRNRNQLAAVRSKNVTDPILFFDPEPRPLNHLTPGIKHLLTWMAIALSFASIMFYMIPRHTQPWFSSERVEVASTGFSQSVDLRNKGLIRQSNQLMFRATFETLKGDRNPNLPTEPPYFRGVALSSLLIENGQTNWRAPHDRVHEDVYQSLSSRQLGERPLKQIITLEESSDPLIYSTMPAVPSRLTPGSIEFCHEISALSRCRINENLEVMPFHYELITFQNREGKFVNSWPYFSNTINIQQLPMSADPPEERWLTNLDPSRYPTVVMLAEKIVAETLKENPDATRIDLVEAMEAYFLTPGQFQYTMDFRDVRWSDNVDAIEDFVRNFRRGHCELFASALVIMLRSQHIPARVVVGFHGGETSQLSKVLMVRGKHAHAWVEAYLRPEDCSSERNADGAAGPGGAWLRLDPTPPSSGASSSNMGTDAMELARSVWQDYVLGMNSTIAENETVAIPDAMASWLNRFDFQGWQETFRRLEKSRQGVMLRYAAAALILIPLILTWVYSLIFSPNQSITRSRKKRNPLRRWAASALSIFSPRLSRWMLTGGRRDHSATAFYDTMLELLQPLGLERQPAQSHREFALAVGQRFSNHPEASLIGSTVWELSEIFNSVRFGNETLPAELSEQIDSSLAELKSAFLLDEKT